MRYYVLIDGAAGGYGVTFPDLPGCTAMGDTVSDAMESAIESLRDWVLAMEAGGDVVPAPRAPDQLLADPEVGEGLRSGAVIASVVLVRDAGKPVKANLSLDAGLLAEIDATASRYGVTRSALVEMMARRALPDLA